MTYTIKYITILFAICFFMGTLTGCSDDPASIDPEDAPVPPSFSQVEPDFSVFEAAENYFQVQPESGDWQNIRPEQRTSDASLSNEEPAFETAAFFAWTANLWFQTAGQFPNVFFNQDMWGEPDLDGNTWVWEYSFAYEEESLTMRVTAQDANNFRNWELRYTYQGPEEENLDNALLISAQVALDGSAGSWQFHDLFKPDAGPVFEIDFEQDGDLTTMADVRFDEEDTRFLFENNGDLNSLRIWEDNQESAYIEWNIETGEGFIESNNYNDGVRTCWDESFQNTEC